MSSHADGAFRDPQFNPAPGASRRLRGLVLAGLVLAVPMSGCDNIFGVDNYDPPNATITGQVLFGDQPVPLRSNGVTLQLRQVGEEFELDTPIDVYLDQDGRFTARVYNGSYKLNTITNLGPWQNSSDTIRFEVQGTATVTVPVTPYYTIQNPRIVYNPAVGTNGKGRVEATFDVINQNVSDPVRAMELVALYVATTQFADRTVPSNLRVETPRTNSAITARLNQGSVPAGSWGGVTQVVNLPADIRVMPGPEVRNTVYARIGVRTTGLSEMIFSPLVAVDISSAPD